MRGGGRRRGRSKPADLARHLRRHSFAISQTKDSGKVHLPSCGWWPAINRPGLLAFGTQPACTSHSGGSRSGADSSPYFSSTCWGRFRFQYVCIGNFQHCSGNSGRCRTCSRSCWTLAIVSDQGLANQANPRRLPDPEPLSSVSETTVSDPGADGPGLAASGTPQACESNPGSSRTLSGSSRSCSVKCWNWSPNSETSSRNFRI